MLPLLAVSRGFRCAAILSAIVLLECVVLAANGGRYPLTDLAARHTLDRAANFDIYLPNWLARYNKAIFGTLFVLSELIIVWRWRGSAVKQTAKAGVLYFPSIPAAYSSQHGQLSHNALTGERQARLSCGRSCFAAVTTPG